MTVDLKWLLPVITPFLLLGMIRVIWFLAGAEWSWPELAAFFSLTLGAMVGAAVTGSLAAEGVHWKVTIGRTNHDRT